MNAVISTATADQKQEEEQDKDLCLLCCSKVISSVENGLSKNLKVIFLLRNLLQVPDTQLERNLEEYGNPENWIRLCDPCSQLTRQAEDLHCQIGKIDRELKNVRKLIVEKTRSSSDPGAGGSEYEDEKKSIWKSTRAFVFKYHYSSSVASSNPFIEGDKHATHLQTLQDYKAPSLAKLEIEQSPFFLQNRCSEDNHSDAELDNDIDWKPQIPTKIGPRPPKKLKYKKIEKINGKFKCRNCDRLLKNRHAHYAHEVSKHVSIPGQHVCDICGQAWDTKKSLYSHKVYKHKLKADGSTILQKIKPIICSSSKRSRVPKKTETTQLSLDKNFVKKTTEKGTWKCHFCDEEFNSLKERLAHEEEKHVSSNGDFKCDICGKSRETVKRLLQHRRRVHNISWAGEVFVPEPPKITPKEPQTCELCGKVYSSRCGLTNHLRLIHERKSGTVCQYCGFRGLNEHGLVKHMFGKHKEEEETKKLEEEGWRLWKCEVVGCRATYLKERGLERHREKYHRGGSGGGDEGNEGDKRWACAFCGKGFWKWNKLNRHEEIHKLKGEKPWKCGRCGGAFSTKQYLRDHERRVHERSKDDV